jgi:hypothetical protein
MVITLLSPLGLNQQDQINRCLSRSQFENDGKLFVLVFFRIKTLLSCALRVFVTLKKRKEAAMTSKRMLVYLK